MNGLKLPLATLFIFNLASPTRALASSAPGTDWVVDAVLVLLVAMSIGVWTVAVWRWRVIGRLQKGNHQFRESFWQKPDIDGIKRTAQAGEAIPFAQLFLEAERAARMIERVQPNAGNGERASAVSRAISAQIDHLILDLEKGAGFLGTTAATAPFIGLFGTVWGILQSFKAIGAMQSASLSVVAPGLSEALIATAVGLVAAIPAVVANNILMRRIDGVRSECAVFGAELVNTFSGTRG